MSGDLFAEEWRVGNRQSRTSLPPGNHDAMRRILAHVAANPGCYRGELWRVRKGYADGFHLERAARTLVRVGLLLESRPYRNWIKLWPLPHPPGSDEATAVEIGLDMLVRGLLEMAGWVR